MRSPGLDSVPIADDEPHIRRLLRLILQSDHQIVEAGDGETVVQLLQIHRPAVAILDVAMPGLAGIEVCRALRRNPQTAGAGVVVVTANGTPADRSAALDAGADCVVTRPCSPTVIQRLVSALLAARPAGGADIKSRKSPAKSDRQKAGD